MTTWEVIEAALANRRPPRKVQWLADQIGASAQVMTNWKKRGVPPARHRDIAQALGLTLDQLAGLAPLPWIAEHGWPFPGIEQARYERLDTWQKGEIQGKVRELIERFEQDAAAHQSGKSSGSGHGAARKQSRA